MHRRCNMSNHSHYKVGCDAHKRYSVFAVCDGKGKVLDRVRVNHERGAIQGFLSQFPSGTPVALETVGNWYWIVDEIEVAGCVALLAHAGKAKAMMGHTHKTDKLDAEGLATLLHNGTLPTVWIPPGDLRDERELPRTRMALSKVRTMLKNRMHSTLAKYALSPDTESDIFSRKWRPQLLDLLRRLPGETQRCMQQELELLDQVQEQIHRLEARILERVQKTPTIQLIQSVPGPGPTELAGWSGSSAPAPGCELPGDGSAPALGPTARAPAACSVESLRAGSRPSARCRCGVEWPGPPRRACRSCGYGPSSPWHCRRGPAAQHSRRPRSRLRSNTNCRLFPGRRACLMGIERGSLEWLPARGSPGPGRAPSPSRRRRQRPSTSCARHSRLYNGIASTCCTSCALAASQLPV